MSRRAGRRLLGGELSERIRIRFVGTLLAGWAYGGIYGSGTERTAALAGRLDWYRRAIRA